MNILKTDLRSRMSKLRLNQLMAIGRLGPEVEGASNEVLDDRLESWEPESKSDRYTFYFV